MLCDGASDDDMRVFREKHRQEACRQFEDRAKETKEKMKLEAEKVSGAVGSHDQYLQRQHSQGQHHRYFSPRDDTHGNNTPRDSTPWKGTPMDDSPQDTTREPTHGQ